MEGIDELFAELNGYEQYQQDLFCWLLRKQAADNEQKPIVREQARVAMARRYATDAVYRERQKAAVKARQKQRYANDPAFRERMKQYARQQYARKQQARAA